MAAAPRRSLEVRVGFATQKGKRPDNQDYVAAHLGPGARGTVAAIADGVGGHKGGREAAELTVRGFIDAYYALPETLGVQRIASRALEPVNQWIHSQGRADPRLSGMSCTFSALVVAQRSGHVIHIGDSRVYRLSGEALDRLTADHVLGRGDDAHQLTRAIGFEDHVKLDHVALSLRQHDRFLLCTDGVWGALNDRRLKALLDRRAPPEETAREIVEAALSASSSDNATALVLDIADLPLADSRDLADHVASLPILALPKPGESIDGFVLGEVISDGRYSRLYRAADEGQGRALVLKFPHPRVAAEAAYRLAFVREAWVAARVRSQWIGEVFEVPPGRQTRLYSLMPFYEGETLEQRLKRGSAALAAGVDIAARIGRAVTALHRAGIVHRDIKPDNVILTSEGGLRLVDLGVARVPRLEDFPAADIPGTPSYMAPELFQGHAGDEASDLYALGVTVHRLFTGAYPYGEVEPFMRPRFAKYSPITRARPDLPAWLDEVVAKAVAVDPAKRFGDVIEFVHELENGLTNAKAPPRRKPSLYERNPLALWQGVCAALLLLVLVLIARDFAGHLR